MENQVGATPNTVMRIASISKSITMAALGKLMDEGRVELDKSVSDLVPEWPKVSTKTQANIFLPAARYEHAGLGMIFGFFLSFFLSSGRICQIEHYGG